MALPAWHRGSAPELSWAQGAIGRGRRAESAGPEVGTCCLEGAGPQSSVLGKVWGGPWPMNALSAADVSTGVTRPLSGTGPWRDTGRRGVAGRAHWPRPNSLGRARLTWSSSLGFEVTPATVVSDRSSLLEESSLLDLKFGFTSSSSLLREAVSVSFSVSKFFWIIYGNAPFPLL